MLWKTVIHIHTSYSRDCGLRLDRLLEACRRRDVDCVGITDHDAIEGALRLRDRGEIEVIVGEEITTLEGHLVGLFLERRIPPDLPVEETCDRIHAQGGLVALPHPFAHLCPKSLQTAVHGILDRVDVVEIGNALNLFRWECRKARRLAEARGLPGYVGGDVHTPWAVGAAYQIMPPFAGPEAFLESLRSATFCLGTQPLRSFFVQGLRDLGRRAGDVLELLGCRRRACPGDG